MKLQYFAVSLGYMGYQGYHIGFHIGLYGLLGYQGYMANEYGGNNNDNCNIKIIMLQYFERLKLI